MKYKDTLDAYLRTYEEAGYRIPIPHIKMYFQKPSMRNAEALLDAFQLHVPFRTEGKMKPSKARSAPVNQVHAARRVVSAHGGTPLPISKEIEILTAVDFLHDIRVLHVPIDQHIYDPLLLPLGLNPKQYDSLSKLCESEISDARFSSNVCAFLEKMFQNNTKRIVLEHIVADTLLHKWVSEWMQKPVLEIVFDGLMCSAAETETNLPPEALRSLCMTAFFSLLIGRYPKHFSIDGPMPEGTRTIRILAGAFQTMDSPLWDRFMQKFVAAFNAEATAIRMHLVSIPLTQPFDKRIRVTSSGVVVDTTWTVPFVRKPSKPTGRTCESYVKHFENNAYTSYPKQKLRTLFQKLARCTEKERALFKPFVKRMVRLNAMRDMYKADIAIRRGALYITVDRMAHLYYRLRCEEQRVDVVQGFYYFPAGVGHTEMVAS